MATKVSARMDYVVQGAAGDGTLLDPFEETLAFSIEEFKSEAKDQIIADKRKIVLALRPIADGKYQMMRRKADIKLSNDRPANKLRLRQLALKVQFEAPARPIVVAAYPITKELEFEDKEIKDQKGWNLILTEEPGAGGGSLFRLYNTEVSGSAAFPPCQNPAIDCANPKNPSEAIYCSKNGCI
jgi:hypothetical protein